MQGTDIINIYAILSNSSNSRERMLLLMAPSEGSSEASPGLLLQTGLGLGTRVGPSTAGHSPVEWSMLFFSVQQQTVAGLLRPEFFA